MTPMLNAEGRNDTLPSSVFNLWGYALRLNPQGGYRDLRLDAGAIIIHLAALQKAAPLFGLKVQHVVLDPVYSKLVRNHPNFYMIKNISFSKTTVWFPHDGHYHVIFKEI